MVRISVGFSTNVAMIQGSKVCAAALQVGGVDQLLELVETGVGRSAKKAHSYPLALSYGEEDTPEVEDRPHAVH